MHVDNPQQPWSNLKVRQALLMATDFHSINNNFYSGHLAEIYTTPRLCLIQGPVCSPEEPACDVQALYSYNPTKAKPYLSDAVSQWLYRKRCPPTPRSLTDVYRQGQLAKVALP